MRCVLLMAAFTIADAINPKAPEPSDEAKGLIVTSLVVFLIMDIVELFR